MPHCPVSPLIRPLIPLLRVPPQHMNALGCLKPTVALLQGPKHITFVGLDVDATGERYEVSHLCVWLPILSCFGFDVSTGYAMSWTATGNVIGSPIPAIPRRQSPSRRP